VIPIIDFCVMLDSDIIIVKIFVLGYPVQRYAYCFFDKKINKIKYFWRRTRRFVTGHSPAGTIGTRDAGLRLLMPGVTMLRVAVLSRSPAIRVCRTRLLRLSLPLLNSRGGIPGVTLPRQVIVY
jgi:hypothetical protein